MRYAVLFNGKIIAEFDTLDSAEYYVTDSGLTESRHYLGIRDTIRNLVL